MRRPLDGVGVSVRVSGDTAEHAARGVKPATDYAALNPRGPLRIGTPVLAPFDIGSASRLNDPTNRTDGGNTLTAVSPDGRKVFVAQHLSGFAYIPYGAPEGTPIALSGNSGKATTGAHLHCYVIIDGVRMSMEEAMFTFASDGSVPFQPTPIRPLEDDMAYPFTTTTGHFFMLAPGFIKHFAHVTKIEGEFNTSAPDLTMRIVSAGDAWIKVSEDEFAWQCDSFGIPWEVVDFAGGMVKNPLTGAFEKGATWSWAKVAAGIQGGSFDIDAIVKATRDAAKTGAAEGAGEKLQGLTLKAV